MIVHAPSAARRRAGGFRMASTRRCNTVPEILSFVIYLSHYQLLPEDRPAELMADLFGDW
jgi:hypothetical protein